MTDFAARVVSWQQRYGRHHLPWQQQRSRYRVWVSEIMLQQTQVTTAIPYFEAFMHSFPSVQALAEAHSDQVLKHWAGLGYYARARNLHKAAQQIVTQYAGELPEDPALLEALPGIGRSTAAAILSLTDDRPLPILDGNVKRVFARHAGIEGWTGQAAVQKKLWALAEARMPKQHARAYNQGLMDLGSQLCRRSKPACDSCPVSSDCVALSEQRQAELPSPKPKKTIPARQAWFLWLEDSEGYLLLEQRPPSGIWGGLWCLPQYNQESDFIAALAEYGVQPKQAQALAPVEHVFSHFKLRLQPYQIRLGAAPKTLTIAENRQRFVDPSALADYGLPAPIEKILRCEAPIKTA